MDDIINRELFDIRYDVYKRDKKVSAYSNKKDGEEVVKKPAGVKNIAHL